MTASAALPAENHPMRPERAMIGQIVMSTIREVAAEQGQILPSLDPGTRLVESGLDSLCLAVIVARLEDVLGMDPLSQSEETTLPVTLGAFVSLYESAAR